MLFIKFPHGGNSFCKWNAGPYQRCEEESRRCAGFRFSFKNSWLALIVEVVKKIL